MCNTFIKYNLFQFILIIDDKLYQINLLKLTIEDLSENTNYPNILKSWKNNLYGHPLKILYYNNPPMSYLKDDKIIGNDGYLLDILCSKLNATCLITNEDSKNFYKIKQTNYDIQFNLKSLYRPKYESDDTKMLYPNKLDNICVLIAEDINPYTFDFFGSKLIKFIYFVGVGFACVIWYLFLKLRRRSITLIDMILIFIRFILLQPIFRKLHFCIEKYIIIVVWLTAMVIYECFLKHFTSQIMVPSYVCNIDTIAQLNSSNIDIYLSPTTFHLLNSTYSNDQYFLNKFTPSNYSPGIRYYSGMKSKIEGFVIYKSVAKLFMKTHVAQRSVMQFHLMKECLVYTPSAYSVEKNMAFTGQINTYMMLIREAGLQHFWNVLYENHYIHDHCVNATNATNSSNANNFDKYRNRMVYKDLFVAFRLLQFCYFLSILVFLLELLVDKIPKIIQKIKNRK